MDILILALEDSDKLDEKIFPMKITHYKVQCVCMYDIRIQRILPGLGTDSAWQSRCQIQQWWQRRGKQQQTDIEAGSRVH